MARQPRIKGGEKNMKSGQKWTRVKLSLILNIYLSDRQFKILKSKETIQKLAKQLDRTIRYRRALDAHKI